MKTLIAFTGGVDSTWLAYRMLTETADDVGLFWMDLFHVKRFKNGQAVPYYNDLLLAEAIVAPLVAAWFSANIRPVTYEVVTGVKPDPLSLLVPGSNSRAWRVIPMMKAAAVIVARDNYDRFMYGKTVENIRAPGQDYRDALYAKWWAEWAPGTTFEMTLVAAKQGRAHALAGLPAPLKAIMLHCNNPGVVDGAVTCCNQCEKCAMTDLSNARLARGDTPDASLDKVLSLRKAGQYIGTKGAGDARYGAGSVSPWPIFDDPDTSGFSRDMFVVPGWSNP